MKPNTLRLTVLLCFVFCITFFVVIPYQWIKECEESRQLKELVIELEEQVEQYAKRLDSVQTALRDRNEMYWHCIELTKMRQRP